MWLSKNLTETKNGPALKIGVVTAGGENPVVSCDGEYSKFLVAGPEGSRYTPKAGDRVLMAEADGQAVCLGPLAEPGTEPGGGTVPEDPLSEYIRILPSGGVEIGPENSAGLAIHPSGEISAGKIRVAADGTILADEGELKIGGPGGIILRASGEISIGGITVSVGGEVAASSAELTLRSASGASVSLKADGTVTLGGVVIGTDRTVRADGFLRN